MKTIKRERQVRLDELLRLVWNGEVVGEKFYDQEKNVLFIDKKDGEIKQADHTCKSDLFTITEEVEIDEYTELRKVVHIDKFGETYDHRNVSIKWLIQYHYDSASVLSDLRYIYLQNDDGSIGELIWKDGGLVG